MSQYKNQERIALEARLNAELRQSRFATRLKNVDDGTPEDTQTLVNQMLDWEKQLGLEIGTVETLIYAYGEDAYQIMDRVQHDTNVFLATIPARIKLTLNPLDQNMPANIIRAFRDTRLTNTEKISCLSNSHKHKLDKNIANNIINQKRNEQKAQYRLLDTASLEELIAVQAYDRAVQYCKDHKLDITDANLTRTDLLPNITSPNRPQLTSNQLNLARKARNNELSAKYNQICGGTASKTVTINNLLAAGVTAEDFQTLANQMHQQMLSVRDNNSKATLPPELCHVIIPGATMKAIDNAAQHKLNSKDYSLRSGQCGTGTRRIFENHTTDKNAKKFYNSFANLQNIPPEISDKGGCRYWLGPERAGLAITLTYENEAYGQGGKTDNKEAIKHMNWLTNHCPGGLMICWENQVEKNDKGGVQPLTDGKKRYENGKGQGHVNVTIGEPSSTDRAYMCDALQKSSDNDSEHGPNKPGWYGEYIRMPFPLDSEVPQEYAKMLIDLAQQRTQGPLNIAKNQEDYQKPAVKKNRTKSPEVTYHPLPTARERNQQQQQQQQQQQPPSRATRRIGSFQR